MGNFFLEISVLWGHHTLPEMQSKEFAHSQLKRLLWELPKVRSSSWVLEAPGPGSMLLAGPLLVPYPGSVGAASFVILMGLGCSETSGHHCSLSMSPS